MVQKNSKLHAAPLSRNAKIVEFSTVQLLMFVKIMKVKSMKQSRCAGLDYPGVSPIHCFLKDTKRARYTFATDEEALNAYQLVLKN